MQEQNYKPGRKNYVQMEKPERKNIIQAELEEMYA